MADHVVGHFSSTVAHPPIRPMVPAWPSLRPEQVMSVHELGRRPTSVVTVGRRWGLQPDPADWRFREDGY